MRHPSYITKAIKRGDAYRDPDYKAPLKVGTATPARRVKREARDAKMGPRQYARKHAKSHPACAAWLRNKGLSW